MQEIQMGLILCREDPLKKGVTTHSSILVPLNIGQLMYLVFQSFTRLIHNNGDIDNALLWLFGKLNSRMCVKCWVQDCRDTEGLIVRCLYQCSDHLEEPWVPSGLPWASLMVKPVKNPSATQETQVWSLSQEDPLEKGMATQSVLLPGEFQGQRRLTGYSPWSRKESDTTERLTLSLSHLGPISSVVGELKLVCLLHSQPLCVYVSFLININAPH